MRKLTRLFRIFAKSHFATIPSRSLTATHRLYNFLLSFSKLGVFATAFTFYAVFLTSPIYADSMSCSQDFESADTGYILKLSQGYNWFCIAKCDKSQNYCTGCDSPHSGSLGATYTGSSDDSKVNLDIDGENQFLTFFYNSNQVRQEELDTNWNDNHFTAQETYPSCGEPYWCGTVRQWDCINAPPEPTPTPTPVLYDNSSCIDSAINNTSGFVTRIEQNDTTYYCPALVGCTMESTFLKGTGSNYEYDNGSIVTGYYSAYFYKRDPYVIPLNQESELEVPISFYGHGDITGYVTSHFLSNTNGLWQALGITKSGLSVSITEQNNEEYFSDAFENGSYVLNFNRGVSGNPVIGYPFPYTIKKPRLCFHVSEPNSTPRPTLPPIGEGSGTNPDDYDTGSFHFSSCDGLNDIQCFQQKFTEFIQQLPLVIVGSIRNLAVALILPNNNNYFGQKFFDEFEIFKDNMVEKAPFAYFMFWIDYDWDTALSDNPEKANFEYSLPVIDGDNIDMQINLQPPLETTNSPFWQFYMTTMSIILYLALTASIIILVKKTFSFI
jgi:hypothetical protein